MSNETEAPRKRISYLFLAIIFITLTISAVALYFALSPVLTESDPAKATIDTGLLLIGGSGFALSAYMLFQTRRKTMRLEIKEHPVITTILCQKCGFKNVRDFQRGDYIFKEAEPCPKCNEKTSVASIYREVEEKH
jgi:hypothetical protein